MSAMEGRLLTIPADPDVLGFFKEPFLPGEVIRAGEEPEEATSGPPPPVRLAPAGAGGRAGPGTLFSVK